MLFTLKETTPLPHRIIPSMSAAHSNTRSQLLTRSQRLRGLVIFVHTVKPHLHVLGRAARAHASGGGIQLEGGPSGGSPRELGLGPDVQTQSTVCRARSGVHSSPGAGRWGAEGSRRCCGRAAGGASAGSGGRSRKRLGPGASSLCHCSLPGHPASCPGFPSAVGPSGSEQCPSSKPQGGEGRRD